MPPIINHFSGRRPNGFLGVSLNDRTFIFLVIILDKTVSVGEDSLCIRTLTSYLCRERIRREATGAENGENE